MKVLNNTNFDASFKNVYSTGYSSYSNKTMPNYQRTISQIKRENQLSRESNRKYIETMYKTGGFFNYDLRPPHLGTHRSHLYSLERRVRDMVPEMDFEKNRLMIFHTQCINFRNDQKNDYKVLKNEMNEEVNNLQLKLMQNLNGQKIENNKNNKEISQIKKDFLDTKNLITELKMRVNSLKLRVDGKEMFNKDGLPILETRID
jgi:hypothetical protein